MAEETYLDRFAVPLEVLRMVALNSPKAAPVTGIDVCKLVQVLAAHSEYVLGTTGQDGEVYWMLSMKEVAAAYMKQTNAQDITPALVGRMLGGMGLKNHRYTKGVVTVWNRRQLEILKKHFGL